MTKEKKIFILSIIILVFLITMGATFAYFGAQSDKAKSVDVNVSASTVDQLKFSNGNAISLSASQDNFGTGSASLSSATSLVASLIANNNTNAATEYYYLYFTIESNTFTYSIDEDTPELILTITSPDGEVKEVDGLTYTTVKDNKNKSISGFDITKIKGLVLVADNKKIVAGSANGKSAKVDETWTFTLTFVNYTKDQSDNEEASLSANVLIQKSPAFADKILLDEANTDTIKAARTSIQNKGTPDFSQNATTDEGVFATTDDDGTAYYFRGAVDDNHVLFGGFCWKIVRTTGTGGVKILYDGLPTNGTCDNTGSDTTIGKYPFNTINHSPAYVGYMYGETSNSYIKDITTLSGSIVFGKSVSYDESTNTYTLVDTYTITNPSNWANEYTNVVKKHYTCFSSSNTCESVNYVIVISSNNKYCYYVTLSKGETPQDILEKTLVNVKNTNESNIKKNIDGWFSTNLSNVEDYLEDTVFCNDREYYYLGGWNKDLSNYDGWLRFNSVQRLSGKKPSLSCSRTIDKFTVSEEIGNGDLTYPVGLITTDEMAMAGGVMWQANTSYYLYNGDYFGSMSPSYFMNWEAIVFGLYDYGGFSHYSVTDSHGVRPLISLKAGMQVESGDGSKTSPYVVKVG